MCFEVEALLGLRSSVVRKSMESVSIDILIALKPLLY
jgi:hypothetical protein